MAKVRAANLGVRFLLEITALAVLFWWGIEAGSTWWQRGALGVGAAGAAAFGWGLFVSPKARVRAGHWLPLAVETAVFGCAVAALADLEHPVLAAALGGIAIVSRGVKAAADLRAGQGAGA